MRPVRYLTKVRIPSRRADVLRRPRLVDYIHQSVDRRVIIVCAPAGYGKTTLLSDFAHDAGLPICWYTVDPEDADPRAFFEYLILSIRQRFPDFGHQTEDLLSSLTDPTRDLNSLVASLVNEIQMDVPDFFMLVLDDYQCLDEADVVSSAMDLLLYYLPDNCRLVLSSRTLPRLTFSRLAASMQVAGLGSQDLRFTSDEVSRLLRDRFKLVLPRRQAEEVVEASEGWITAILLTTHTPSMAMVGSLVKAKDAGGPLFDYLANEVFLRQPEDIQRFLLCSSVLDLMSADLCDRAFAEGAARDVLERLSRDSLFIESVEGDGAWYRYHNLFQSFLRSRLKQYHPDLHHRMNVRAAELAEAQGDWDRAIEHYHEAGELDAETALVERMGDQLLNTGHWQTLHRWLGALPSEVILAKPRLGLYRGHTYLWSGETEDALVHLARAAADFREVGDAEGAGAALTIRASALRVKGRFVEAVADCTEAIALQTDSSSRVSADAHRDIGLCLAAQAKLADASVEFARAMEIYQGISDRAGTALLAESMGIVAVRLGDLARGMSHYQQALNTWRQIGRLGPLSGVLNSIGMVYCHTGEIERARETLEEALEKAQKSGYARMQACILGSLGDVKRASSDLRGAHEAYEAALDIAHRVDEAQQVCYLLDGLANVHRRFGDYATAERLLRQALQQAEDDQFVYETACISISLGVLAEEMGDLGRAEKLLRPAIDRMAQLGAQRDAARARFHLARTLHAAGKTKAAERQLVLCLTACGELGYDHFMVAEGERSRDLVGWAVSSGIGGRRLQLVSDRLSKVSPTPETTKPSAVRIEGFEPHRIAIRSFGHAEVNIDDRLVSSGEWAVEKTKELFFFLLHQSSSLRREQIVDSLWPDLEDGKGSSQFHSTVYRLRRATFPQSLPFKDGRYRLVLGNNYSYDYEEFLRLLQEAEEKAPGSRAQMDAFQSAIDLYRGPFLEEFYSDWVDPIRGETEERYVRALNRLASLRAANGAFEHAIQLLRMALATDPYMEDVHYRVIHYWAVSGDRTSALRHYKTYQELLQDELGAKPGAQVTNLVSLITAGKPLPTIHLPKSL